MILYRGVRPALFALDAERAHRLTARVARSTARVPGAIAAVRARYGYHHPALSVEALGLRFDNPIGLAAGFDKDGEMVEPLSALGFGFLELGSVTPLPQPGNPRPRLFRLPEDEAVINRMGFNNHGAPAMADRLHALRDRPIPLGVNLGKNKDTPLERATDDYVAALRAIHGVADYVVINVSSPNTPGLRVLQQAGELRALLRTVREARDALAGGRRLPLLVKVASDLSREDLEAAGEAARMERFDGVIATNTTLARDGLRSARRDEAGGLSGRPLHGRAVETIQRLHAELGSNLVLIGVGGVSSGDDALALIRAGATLVQLYTGLIYQGPGLVRRIKRELVKALEREGFSSAIQAVATDYAAVSAGY